MHPYNKAVAEAVVSLYVLDLQRLSLDEELQDSWDKCKAAGSPPVVAEHARLRGLCDTAKIIDFDSPTLQSCLEFLSTFQVRRWK